jgi:16S rRNA (cytosine1402-N4)-methyltransferase
MHEPVLVREMIDLMAIKVGGAYVDGTAGGGGHASAILERAGVSSRLLAIDRDVAAIARVRERFADSGFNIALVHGNFSDLEALATVCGFQQVDGVVLDLGVSSFQLDEADRGFSFRLEGPLDMRMDASRGATAADLVNQLSCEELAELIWRLGEEPASRRIAAAIVRARAVAPITTTGGLAEVVRGAKGGRRGARIDPATQTFQALRMAVNAELDCIGRGVEAALRLVRPGGRVGVISFHSLEDRLVKRTLAAHVGRMESLPQGGERWVGVEPVCRWITRKPVQPSEEECAANPRARSAKLRVVERVS